MSKSVEPVGEMSREQIQEHLFFYECSTMKRQQANAQVCRQLLAAMNLITELQRENNVLRSQLAKPKIRRSESSDRITAVFDDAVSSSLKTS